MKLRPYQQKALDSIMHEWFENDATLLILPTGAGKTIVFSQVARLMGHGKVLVLAHREELIWQAKDKIEKTTGLKCAVEMANWTIDPTCTDLFHEAKVIISTVQSQISGKSVARMKKFNPMEFSAIIIDEVHHAVSTSYRKVIDHYKQNPELRFLGVTATPDRGDKKPLGILFHSVAFDYEILDAINDGWLVPIEQQLVTIHGLDFSKVRVTAGELNGADLIRIMEEEKTMQGVASASVEIIGDKKTIVFTAGVRQAEVLSEIFNRHKPGMSTWICGKTPKEVRRETLGNFAEGKVQVVCNCGILTEGFDDPSVEVIIMARPTMSRSLYSQMIGRATRALPGIVDQWELPEERKSSILESKKPSCLVVDFVGNSGRHKLVTSADILGGDKIPEEVITKAIEEAKKSGKPKNVMTLLTDAQADIERKKEEQRQLQIQLEAARKARVVAQAEYSQKQVDPFGRYNVKMRPPSEWEKRNLKPLSDPQKNVLRKAGVDPEKVSVSSAKELIGKICSTPSDPQKRTLVKYGYSTDCSRKKASEIIGELVANGWRRPDANAF